MAMQYSFFDAIAETAPPDLTGRLVRTELGRGAWIDLATDWLPSPQALFDQLAESVPWRAEERPMYDRVVAVPRLLSFYGLGVPLPHLTLSEVMIHLNDYYAAEMAQPLETVGLCYYRDGNDSVAFHGDRIGRGARHDTIVAICSLGATRRFLVRPRGGGRSSVFEVGSGDLLVMGGSCQRAFEHAVPKTRRPVGPRISVQYRENGVR